MIPLEQSICICSSTRNNIIPRRVNIWSGAGCMMLHHLRDHCGMCWQQWPTVVLAGKSYKISNCHSLVEKYCWIKLEIIESSSVRLLSSSHSSITKCRVYGYLQGKLDDSPSEKRPPRVYAATWKNNRVRAKLMLMPINRSKSRYRFVWSGKCLICNLEEGSPWPRLSKTLCQGWGEPIILAIFVITPYDIALDKMLTCGF